MMYVLLAVALAAAALWLVRRSRRRAEEERVMAMLRHRSPIQGTITGVLQEYADVGGYYVVTESERVSELDPRPMTERFVCRLKNRHPIDPEDEGNLLWLEVDWGGREPEPLRYLLIGEQEVQTDTVENLNAVLGLVRNSIRRHLAR